MSLVDAPWYLFLGVWVHRFLRYCVQAVRPHQDGDSDVPNANPGMQTLWVFS